MQRAPEAALGAAEAGQATLAACNEGSKSAGPTASPTPVGHPTPPNRRGLDIYKVNDLLSKQGWHLNALQVRSAAAAMVPALVRWLAWCFRWPTRWQALDTQLGCVVRSSRGCRLPGQPLGLLSPPSARPPFPCRSAPRRCTSASLRHTPAASSSCCCATCGKRWPPLCRWGGWKMAGG